MTVRIRFTTPCLGNVKDRAFKDGRFTLPRVNGRVVLMPTWHAANMVFAADLLSRRKAEAKQVQWDLEVDCVVRRDSWFKRYYAKPTADGGQRSRHVLHEAILAGETAGLNCCVPDTLCDEDLWRLVTIAGQYRGVSPFQDSSRTFGRFQVESIRPRWSPVPDPGNEEGPGGRQTAGPS